MLDTRIMIYHRWIIWPQLWKLIERASWRRLLILIKLNTNTFNSRRHRIFSQKIFQYLIWVMLFLCFCLSDYYRLQIRSVRQTSKVKSLSKWNTFYISLSCWISVTKHSLTTPTWLRIVTKKTKRNSAGISLIERKRNLV